MIARESDIGSRAGDFRGRSVGRLTASKADARRGFDMNIDSVSGVVFCGGKSRRMGRDKAELPAPDIRGDHREHSLLENAIAVLEQVAPFVFLASGDAPREPAFGKACVLDVQSGAGPLAGLVAALEACDTTWLCVLACDMPVVEAEIFHELLAHARQHQLDICLLESTAGIEPLCGVYKQSCAPAARRCLESGQRKMSAFHGSRLRVGTLAATEFAAREDCARNLNTPEEYIRVMNYKLPNDTAGERS